MEGLHYEQRRPDQKGVTLTLNFSPDQEALLETVADAAGLCVKCYCI